MPPHEAKIRLRYHSRREAEAIVKSVTPDDKTAPKNVAVKTRTARNAVISRIICRNGLKTFIATMDDLLASIQVAEKVLRGTQK